MNLQQQLARCQQHQQLLQLPHFNHETAWRLGEKIKCQAEQQGAAQRKYSLFQFCQPPFVDFYYLV